VRRILAILLLAVLPFQFSWAAVASYCGHETLASPGTKAVAVVTVAGKPATARFTLK